MSSFTVEAILKASGGEAFQKTFDQAQKAVSGFKGVGDAVGNIGKKMTMGLTVPLLGVGTAAIATVANFDDSMANVAKISGAVGTDFDNLREKAQELGSKTAFSASEAADGMGVLAASGMKTNDIIGVSADMFNLMSAGSVDAETSASILTNTMAQFNLEADDSGHIVDTFASGAANAKISVDDLEHGMAMAGGAMSNMNMTVEDSVAVMGHLANGAIPVAQLGSTVNAMSQDIIANSEEMSKYAKVYDESTGAMRGMDEIMGDLENSLDGKSDAEKNAVLQTLFGAKAQRGANAWITKGTDAYKELTEEMARQENAAETMAAIQEDTIGGAFRAVSSATEGMMIELGDVLKGPIQGIALKLSEMAGAFGKLSDPMKKAIVVFGGVAAAIGPVLLVVSGLLKMIAGAPAAIALLMGPVGAIIAAVVAVIAIGALLIANWGEIKQAASDLFEYLFPNTEQMKIVFEELWKSIKENFSAGNFAAVADQFGLFVDIILEALWDAIPEMIETGLGMVDGLITGITTKVPEFIAKGLELVLLFATVLAENLPKLLVAGMDFVTELIKGLAKKIPEWLAKGVEMVVKIAQSIGDNLPKIIQKGGELLLSAAEGFRDNFPKMIAAAVELIRNLVSSLADNFPKLVAAGVDMLIKIVGGILKTIPKIWAAAKEVAGGVMDTIKAVNWSGLGKDIIAGLGRGISASAGALWTAAKGVLGGFKDKVLGFFGVKSPSRWMANNVGKYIPSGIGMGIEKNEKPMLRSAISMSKALASAVTVPTMDIGGSIARSNAQVKSAVSHEISNASTRQPATLNLSIGGRDFTAFVDDISGAQSKRTRLELGHRL